jgi:hypothetical protein
VWQCLICGEYARTYTEVCRFCSADCLEWVQEEDVMFSRTVRDVLSVIHPGISSHTPALIVV